MIERVQISKAPSNRGAGWGLHRIEHPARNQHAFTMIEIAIALAVIAFALVAIIGVLPTGLTVQKQNLEDTIINHDGVYFLEAIRSGAEGIHDLSNYVFRVSVLDTPYEDLTGLSGAEIIGLLSTPGTTNIATVRAISGSAAEKGSDQDIRDFAFKYQLRVEVEPFLTWTNDPWRTLEERTVLSNYLHNVRLEFQWPLLPNGDVGTRRRVFRGLVAGSLREGLIGTLPVYFFSER